MADLKFSVEAFADTKTKTVVKVRGFEIIMDEPEHLGGKNLAPNPLEVMLASHAGCINVISHIVADQMKIKIEKLEIEVSGTLEIDVLFGRTQAERAGFKSIEAIIKLSCNASKDKINEWFQEVERRCPIGENLRNTTRVISYLKTI